MAHGTGGAPCARGECVTATSGIGVTATSTAEVRDRVREAIAHQLPLRIVGGGSWLDANRPVRAGSMVVASGAAGIVEYEPGDLTITVRAGTTLAEIAHATAAHRQWLTLDPYGDHSRATIGATIATASFGPLAHHFGTPRDLTLGVEFVAGTGDIVRGGGRVVKNVAGFDLTRLLTGSWGSLGIITEATLRLRAIPAVQPTIAIELASAADKIEQARTKLHVLPFLPLAAELVDATLARAISVGDGSVLLVRLGGNEEAVRAQRDQLAGVGVAQDTDAEVWRRLREAEPTRAAVLRLSRLPSRFAMTWRDAQQLVAKWPGGYCHGTIGRGIVRVVLPLGAAADDRSLHEVLDVPLDGQRIYERLPSDLWNTLAPSAIHNRLERDIKAAFDPQNVLNPGILGETP
jgi:glycolate oxidase FAD binding subunit